MAGQSTRFNVDMLNPTGYSQVLQEFVSSYVLNDAGDPSQGGSWTQLDLYRSYLISMQILGQSFANGYASAVQNVTGLTYNWLDAQGNLKMLLSATGLRLTMGAFDYDAFGSLLPESDYYYGGMFGARDLTITSLGYAGEYRDPNTGLIYLRDRWMNVTTGRFTQMDRYRRGAGSDLLGWNLFGYANGDPVNGRDPSGLYTLPELLTGITVLTLMNGAIGGAIGAKKGLRGAVGGAAGAAVSTWTSSWLTIALIPATGVLAPALGSGFGSMLGTAYNISIVDGFDELSTTEGIVQLALSFMIGASLGFYSQGATAHLAGQIGKKMLSVDNVRTVLQQAASGSGIHSRSFAQTAEYLMENPSVFWISAGKYVFSDLPTIAQQVNLFRAMVGLGGMALFGPGQITAITPLTVNCIKMYHEIVDAINAANP